MDDTNKPVRRLQIVTPQDFYRSIFGEPKHGFAVDQATESNEAVGPVLNLKAAAALLQCHPKTLRLMAQAKKVPARRVGKLWRFSALRLKEWIEANE